MNRQAIDDLKQRIPLLDYLKTQNWQPLRRLPRNRWMGLCPLHPDQRPSFVLDSAKGLFYCYGCGRGGDIIRFAELHHQVRFPRAVETLRQWYRPALHAAAEFYHQQLRRHDPATEYLSQRGIRSPELIEHMRIGYAPGASLRRYLTEAGYTLPELRHAGMVDAAGHDSFTRRLVFPLEGNLYGRSISGSAPPHRLLPGGKGGLYDWERVRQCPNVILVEGLFDYAALWQTGFQNVTCGLGTHLNTQQLGQLCRGPRTVYLAFDADFNGSGQQAAESLAARLRAEGLNALIVTLPEGHDPNSFFNAGGAVHFRALLESAQ